MALACRLCLNEVIKGFYFKINQFDNANIVSTKEKLVNIFPEIDIDITKDPVICRQCYMNVQFCYNFKAGCIENNSQIMKLFGKLGADAEFQCIVKDVIKTSPNSMKTFKDEAIADDPHNLLSVGKIIDYHHPSNLQYDCQNRVNSKPQTKQSADNHRKTNVERVGQVTLREFFKRYLEELENSEHFRCPRCQKRFQTTNQIRNHLRETGHYRTMRQFNCGVCSKKFIRARNFNEHMLVHSNENNNPLGPILNRNLHSAKNNSKTNNSTTNNSMTNNTTTNSSTTNTSTTNNSKTNNSTTNNSKRNISMTNNSTANKRKRLKGPEKPHKVLGVQRITHNLVVSGGEIVRSSAIRCVTCKEICPNEESYKNHSKTAHSGTHRFCNYCRKTFSSVEKYTTHLAQYEHQKLTKFRCSMCFMYFKNTLTFAKHMDLHENFAKHKCKMCNVRYSRLYRLKEHVKRMHPS